MVLELTTEEAQIVKFLLKEHVDEMEDLNALNDESDAKEIVHELSVVRSVIEKL